MAQEFSTGKPFMGVIPSEAVFHAERGTSLSTQPWRGRSLVPRVKTRDFGMTPVTCGIFKLRYDRKLASVDTNFRF